MRTIRLLLEYDGTNFAGWQVQANGLSVQAVVEEALARVLGGKVRLVSAGRTDAGVHARGMVAHFHTETDLPLSAFREGVNRYLPGDIAVRAAEEVPDDFHARYSARGKWYRYTLYLGQMRSPLADRTSWHVRAPLDLQVMAQAARTFVGEHDFTAFRTTGCAARTTRRRIFSLDLVREGPFLFIDVKGDGFLRNMVRIMVGTLVEIGREKRPAEEVARLLRGGASLRSGPTAPPQGLCLMEVWY